LQEDLQRYADGRRVLARPDTVGYRARRFVRRKRSAVVAASAVVLATLGASAIVVQASGGTSLIGRGLLKEREPLVVADFGVTGADSALAPMLTYALRMHLDQSRVISVVPEDRVRSARLALDRPFRRLDAALSREVARREGVRAVVAGDLVAGRSGYDVKLRLLAASTGEELASVQATAKDAETELLPAVEKLARQLRGRIGESLRDVRAEPMPDPVTTSSLEALRLYTAARRSPAGDVVRRVALFRQAIARDSMFAMAYVGLGGALSGHSAAARDSALRKAYELRDRLSGRERVAATAWYYMLTAHDSRRAIALYEEHLARDSTDWRATVNLGILYGATRQFARAESLYRSRERALGGVPEDNLVYALLAQGKVAAADTLVSRVLTLRPDNSDAMRASTFSAVTKLQYDSAAARAGRWRGLLASPGSQLGPMGMLVQIARVRGRLAEARRIAEEAQLIRASIGLYSRPVRDSMDLVAEDLWLRRRPERAVARLEAALDAHSLQLPGTVDDQADALAAAALYAAAGQPKRARALVQAAVIAVDSPARGSLTAPYELALGEIALAEGSFGEALAAFRRSDLAQNGWLKNSWLTGLCAVCILPRLARVADRAGWRDSALIHWERYVSAPSIDREGVDAWFLAMAYRRMAELHAAGGERTRAEEAAASLASLWHRADPELQSQVAAVRGRGSNAVIRREARRPGA
jgi:tetratricopeptide (TPR) repeat protein